MKPALNRIHWTLKHSSLPCTTEMADSTMMYIMFILADSFFNATRRNTAKDDHPKGWSSTETPQDDIWDVTASDNLTGKQHRSTMTTEQVQAVACLAIAGDDAKFMIPERAYAIAEEAVKNWPKEVRPIP